MFENIVEKYNNIWNIARYILKVSTYSNWPPHAGAPFLSDTFRLRVSLKASSKIQDILMNKLWPTIKRERTHSTLW